MDISTREALREAIRINAVEMDRLRQALTERELRAAHLKQAADAMEVAAQREPPASEAKVTVPDGFGQRQRQRLSSLAWATRRETYLILKRHGRPMTRKELLSELSVAGLKFNPKDPLQALTKILSGAKKEFYSTGEGYWFRDEPKNKKNKPTK
ncbi:hypothetical protein [Rhizobium gallicum]|uniref:hypothetical protein n=1 Tax=Rhizobium gallicum TaxID=56730 RepID=UPI00093C415D|nr:hypothetical protein [Rhizobium gallicum]